MKKFKYLFVLFLSVLVIPFSVFAEEGDTKNNNSTEENQKVNVYFFHGDGCGNCASAEEFFDSIEEEYGDKFNLVMYEIWYNEDNSNLMQRVAEARHEEANGVPYIIIGNQSWIGYLSSYDNEIIEKIESEYDTLVDERYDIMDYVDGIDPSPSNDNKTEKTKSYAGDIAIVIAIVFVSAAISGSIWYARKKTV